MKLPGPSGTVLLSMVLEPSLASRARAMPTSEDVHSLYVAYAAELRLTLSRLSGNLVDPDDLLHEVFVVALRNTAELARANSARAWLYGVATKVAATRRRGARLRRFFGLELAEHHPSPESPLRSLEQKEASEQISKALEGLSAAKREVFVLFELQQLKGEEISQALAIPLKTVWTRLFHARRDLATELERLQKLDRGRDA